MDRLRRLIAELHRRSLWQVLGIYLIGSWAGFEVISELTDRIGLPDWVPGFAVVLFIIGLPIVLATAFVQEGVPVARGRKRSTPPRRSRATPRAATQEAAPSPVSVAAEPVASPPRGRHLLFTWQRAILGGVVAFLLLGITAGGYMGLRNAGIGPFGSLIAKGELADRERILIADFQYPGGDTLLAAAMTQAFRVDFEQSRAVSVVNPAYVGRVLERMEREPGSRLTPELAREVAQRDGIKAVLVGEILHAGGSYVLSARITTAESGEALASYRETAADSTALLPTVDRLSKKLREKIGESLRSIRAAPALQAVTTPSLEALRKYSQANRALDAELDFTLGIQLLEEALALDSTFAMAWRKLAVAYNNSGAGRDKIVAAVTRAYAYRDRLTDRERYHTVAYYHNDATQDWSQAAAAYRALLDAYPDDYAAHNNLGVVYLRLREYDRAAEQFTQSVAADSSSSIAWRNLADTYTTLGRYDDALRTLDGFDVRFGERPDGLTVRYYLATARGDDTTATLQLRRIREMRRGDALWRALVGNGEADLANLRGRLSDAERHRRDAVAAELERGNVWAPLQAQLWTVSIDLLARRDAARAIARLDAAIRAYPLAEMPLLNRPYLAIAEQYAASGRPDRAREFVALHEREVSPELRGDIRTALARIRGFSALAENRLDEAIRELRSTEATDICTLCPYSDLARAYDAAGQPDSAIALYERFLATPSSRRIWSDAYELGSNYERLSQLYDARGNTEKAAYYAVKFVELWKDADPELQSRVQAGRRMLERLRGPG